MTGRGYTLKTVHIGKTGRFAPLLGGAAIVIAAVVIFASLPAVASAGWSDPVDICGDLATTSNDLPQIALDSGGNPHVTWYGNDGSTNRIYYTENTGAGWAEASNISGTSTPSNNRFPQIALDSSGNPHVTWQGYDGSTDRIYYTENTGAGWAEASNISGTSTPSNNRFPQIALDSSGNPHVAWFGYDGSTDRIYYSANTGAGWTEPLSISSTTSGNDDPQLALDSDGNPHVAWFGDGGAGNRVYYSKNTGTEWTTPVALNFEFLGSGSYPLLALDSGGNPYILWLADYIGQCIYFSVNTGAGWSHNAASDYEWDKCPNELALDPGDNPHITWRSMDWDFIDYRAKVGGEWTHHYIYPVPGTTGLGNSRLALDSGDNPHVIFSAYDGETRRLYYTAKTGAEWPEAVCISAALPNIYCSQIAMDSSDNLHVVWRGGYNPNYRIYYSANLKYDVDATVSGGNGTVDPNTQIVDQGGDATIDIYPDPGYQVSTITDNGNPQAVSNPYVITNVTESHTVVVTFALAPTITPKIIDVSPNSIHQGEAGVNIAILGEFTHFEQGSSSASFSGTGITVNSTSVIDSTHATANITVDINAPTGFRDVNIITGSEVPEPLVNHFIVQEHASTPPQLDNLEPKGGYVGTPVTLSGDNFGDERGLSYVSFNGTLASIYESWANIEIVCHVPSSATTGPVTVTTSEGTSGSKQFTVVQTPPPSATPTPSQTPTPSVTQSPTPSMTLSPTASPTSIPPTASSTLTPSPPATPHYLVISSGDYNGDGISDIAVFRQEGGLWAVRGLGRTYFGTAGDIPVSGDYDGDGNADVSIFRPATGLWAVKEITRLYFGDSDDMPVPGDYDGDGTCDVAVFAGTSGLWSVRELTRLYYGTGGDRPVPVDYDDNGRADIAVFRPATGLWAIRGLTKLYFGAVGDQPVPSVYQWYGVGKVSGPFRSLPAIFRPATGLWAVRGLTRLYFGTSDDSAVIGDFDGDLLDEIGIFRPSSGLWAIRGMTRAYYGTSGDIPVTR